VFRERVSETSGNRCCFRIFKLGLLSISRFNIKFRFWFNLNLYHGVWVSQFGGSTRFGIFIEICSGLLIDSIWPWNVLLYKIKCFRAISHQHGTKTWSAQDRSLTGVALQIKSWDTVYISKSCNRDTDNSKKFSMGRIFAQIFIVLFDLTSKMETWLNLWKLQGSLIPLTIQRAKKLEPWNQKRHDVYGINLLKVY